MAVIYVESKEKLPKRVDYDVYRTPPEFVDLGLKFLWDMLARDNPDGQPPWEGWRPCVLDPGAGDGAWGAGIRRICTPGILVGVELRPDEHRPEAYDQWLHFDFRDAIAIPERTNGYDLVVGNPPYSDGEAFVRKSLGLLRSDGYLLFLLKLSFLQSKGRAEGLFQEFPPRAVAVCKRRPPFTGPGNTDSYAFYCWRKGCHGRPELEWI